MVITQANTISVVTFQRTAETRFAARPPLLAPVIVCRVETGTRGQVARDGVVAPPGSAQKRGTGVSRVMPEPVVCTMRQPANSVRSAIAAWQAIATQNGTYNSRLAEP